MAVGYNLQIKLSPQLRAALEKEADRRGIRATELTRAILSEHLTQKREEQRAEASGQ
jgi:hypothetical protein